MKFFKRIFLTLVILLLGLGIFYYPKLNKVRQTLVFFTPENILHNFTHMNEFADSREIEKSSQPYHFPKATSIELPASFSHAGQEFSAQEFLDSSFTTGFLVIQDDSLVFEEYYQGHTESTRHISWSMAKSFVSTLFGMAVEEGAIRSLEEPVETYAPSLIGSGYEGVRIKDVLQMASGVGFNEDYGDLSSDINRWGRSFAWGSSQDAFAATLVNEREPGTYHHYVSINTHVLGMILVQATGKSLTEYLHEKIWEPLGMEYNAYWLVDDYGMEMALGGMNVCLRDYAKMGQFVLQKGNWQGQQLVSEAWIEAATTPDAPHLMPGKRDNSAHSPIGYGYQWWIPESDEGEFMAQGVYNQYIYINPTTHTVIVKNSANPRYNDKSIPYSRTEDHLALFRAIAHGGRRE